MTAMVGEGTCDSVRVRIIPGLTSRVHGRERFDWFWRAYLAIIRASFCGCRRLSPARWG